VTDIIFNKVEVTFASENAPMAWEVAEKIADFLAKEYPYGCAAETNVGDIIVDASAEMTVRMISTVDESKFCGVKKE
jgi:hypothetical protein